MESDAPDPRIRTLRHDFRGHIQNVVLMVHALELCDSDDERLEYLDSLIDAADKSVKTLSELRARIRQRN